MRVLYKHVSNGINLLFYYRIITIVLKTYKMACQNLTGPFPVIRSGNANAPMIAAIDLSFLIYDNWQKLRISGATYYWL